MLKKTHKPFDFSEEKRDFTQTKTSLVPSSSKMLDWKHG
jgi:hypothetical protein